MASLPFKNDPSILFSGLLVLGAWYWYSNTKKVSQTSDNFLGSIDEGLDTLKTLTGINAISDAKASHLRNPNAIAFLKVIRAGEGTADADGYRRIFGGQLFTSFADHPRKAVTKKSGAGTITSTAAGAYQFLASTWDETRQKLGLNDFSPASQDLAALGRIAYRGALDDVLSGRFEQALRKVSKEWASMPYSPYGQPTITLAKAKSVFNANGGKIA